MSLLNKLSAVPGNEVIIISGRDSESLERWFGSLPMTLISEHGAAVKDKTGEGWREHVAVDQSWKQNIRPILEIFCQRTPGSFIEEKKHTIAWHYRRVDSELGFIRSRELVDNLHHILRNASLQVVDGNKVIEIRIPGINKGEITRQIIETNQFDFVLAVGDDKTDEDMFKILAQSAFTVKIGPGHTSARFHVHEQMEVLSMLQNFAFDPN